MCPPREPDTSVLSLLCKILGLGDFLGLSCYLKAFALKAQKLAFQTGVDRIVTESTELNPRSPTYWLCDVVPVTYLPGALVSPMINEDENCTYFMGLLQGLET